MNFRCVEVVWYCVNACNTVFSSNHRIFYRARSLKNLEPHVVLDSNKIPGIVVAHVYSPNAQYCAFTVCNEDKPSYIHVVDVETGLSYGRSLKFEHFYKYIVWSGDSKGFFAYVR